MNTKRKEIERQIYFADFLNYFLFVDKCAMCSEHIKSSFLHSKNVSEKFQFGKIISNWTHAKKMHELFFDYYYFIRQTATVKLTENYVCGD